MSVGPVPQTIADLIAADTAAAATITADQASLTAAQATVAALTTTLSNDVAAKAQTTAAVGTALTQTGPAFVVGTDGKASIYTSDNGGGYHVTLAVPLSTAIPGLTPPSVTVIPPAPPVNPPPA